MQIEIIGATGAGKSTLIKRIVDSNRQQVQEPLTSYDFVLQHFGVAWVRSHKLRMLLLNLLALTYCLVHWRKYQPLLHFCRTFLQQLPPTVAQIDRLKLARIVLRNIGIDEIVRRYSSQRQLVIADEGILQIAHYLFVHLGIEPDLAAVARFMQIAPLPDVIVYLQPPLAVLVDRTVRRGHHRIAVHVPEAVTRFIGHAVTVFDYVAHLPNVQQHLLQISGEPTQMKLRAASTQPQVVMAQQLFAQGLAAL